MTEENKWQKKDEWKKHGKDFCVVVSRHDGYDTNNWCVYAYIYPKHDYFVEFDKTQPMYQEAASAMPLHGGPTYLKFHEADGKVTSVQVGADYQHIYDDRFSLCQTKEDAYEVFQDAEKLFKWLTKEQTTGEQK
jgi:hypothetical protein